MEDVERRLIAGRPPRYVQLATAAAPEGPESLGRWHALGKAAAARLGVEQVIIPVVDRVSADDPALASLVEGAGLIYLSGGQPAFSRGHPSRNRGVGRDSHGLAGRCGARRLQRRGHGARGHRS